MNRKEELVKLMVTANVLKFGEFETKSGRLSPYFINTGNYSNGMQIALLGEYYADFIMEKLEGQFDFLYGPAYKGITLACATSIALYKKYGLTIPYSFNRKEAKDHGEKGQIVSYQPKDGDVGVIIEDVVSAGTSVKESMSLLKSISNVNIKHLVISCDRNEIGYNNKTATDEIKEEFGITTHSIINISDILNILYNKKVNGKIIIDDVMKNKIEDYMNKYCKK